MEDEKILIDRKTLKAISSDTRMDILKYLSSRKYTLTELSEKTSLKNPTIKEHLDHLIDSNLVKREESDNKWKYYSLTEKGKKLVKPKEVKILISFVISLIATFGVIGIYIFNSIAGKTKLMSRAMDSSIEQSAEIMSSSLDVTVTTTDLTTPIIQSSLNKEVILVIAILILVTLTIFLLVFAIKENKNNKNNCIKIID
jgi:DNA-binding MarR family transcriptional regulator